MKTTQRWGFAGLALALAACTSIEPEPKDEHLVVHSYPEGARFTTDTGQTGTTPAVVAKERGKVMHVRFELPGYEAEEVAVHAEQDCPQLDSLMLSDLLLVLSPEAPRAVTASDGEVHVALEPAPAPPPATSESASDDDRDPR